MSEKRSQPQPKIKVKKRHHTVDDHPEQVRRLLVGPQNLPQFKMPKLQGPFPAPSAAASRAPTLEDTGYSSQSGNHISLLVSGHTQY